MIIKKGDLILTDSTGKVSVCVILSDRRNFSSARHFYYCYNFEEKCYGIVYDEEVVSILENNFQYDPDVINEIFYDDYYWYELMLDQYRYFPTFFDYDWDQDADDDDEDLED